MTTAATTLNEGALPGEQAVCLRAAAEIGRRRGRPAREKVDSGPQFPGKTRDPLAGRAGFSSGKEYEGAKSVVEQGAPNAVAATFSFAESTVQRWMNAAERCGAKSEVTSVLKRVVPLLMSHQTAYPMVQAAEDLGERFNTVLNAGPKASCALAAPSADAERRREYLSRAGSAEREAPAHIEADEKLIAALSAAMIALHGFEHAPILHAARQWATAQQMSAQMAEAIATFLRPRLDDAPASPPHHQAHARTGQPADGESPAQSRAEVTSLTPSPVPTQKEHAR